MSLKQRLRSLTAPMAELDADKLREFCAGHPQCCPIDAAQPRQEVSLVGEISGLRIVPRAGSPSLEATISDGSGSVVVVWTGRRRIAGIAPGKRLIINGRGAPIGPSRRLLFYNPRYELL
ncbi:MAG TPA: OB-fold nucleic acid binding domain-containing protein [Acidimicrobiales bacterium]|nr:OB-fold nucleic acid binding domain-containing protein [Acidimicrobiales bacterium]